jgi:hypothetical protein
MQHSGKFAPKSQSRGKKLASKGNCRCGSGRAAFSAFCHTSTVFYGCSETPTHRVEPGSPVAWNTKICSFLLAGVLAELRLDPPTETRGLQPLGLPARHPPAWIYSCKPSNPSGKNATVLLAPHLADAISYCKSHTYNGTRYTGSNL